MIFQNIDFHNVEEIVKDGDGYRMYRFPRALAEKMEDGAERISNMATGVELRFRIKGDKAVLRLRAEAEEEAQVAYIYFGAFQGGWYISSKVIHEEETRITIARPENMETMKAITGAQQLGFDPEVVRVVLPYGCIHYLGVEGEIEAPSRADYPEKTYLAYGSSITHGSLSLAMPYSYPFRISQKADCDYINLGMAGSARLEKVFAEYLVSRKDWDFASLELGINMRHNYSEEAFEERVRDFLDILVKDGRPVFVTNLFGFQGELQEKGQRFREIVKKYAVEPLVFTDGLELLSEPHFVSQDLVHPSLEGMEGIAEKWYRIMRERCGELLQA